MPRWVPANLSSRETRYNTYVRRRPSRSPTVNINNTPTCLSRARPCLSRSSRRPAHTATRTATHTHKHAHTHTQTTRTRTRTRTRNARTNARTRTRTRTRTRASARTRARAHAPAPAPAHAQAHTHAPAHRACTSARPRARTRNPRDDPRPPRRQHLSSQTSSGAPIQENLYVLCAHRFAPLPGTARTRRPK